MFVKSWVLFMKIKRSQGGKGTTLIAVDIESNINFMV
jgi:hypothetical protein